MNDSQTPSHSPIIDDFARYVARLSEHHRAVTNAVTMARQVVTELEKLIDAAPPGFDQTQPRRAAIRGIDEANNIVQTSTQPVGYITPPPTMRRKRRKRSKHVTVEMHREMMRRHANGDQHKAIAKALGVSITTVDRWVEDTKQGIARTYVGDANHRSNHPRHFTPEKKAEVIALARVGGWTAEEIAELADISVSTAQRYIKRVQDGAA